VKPQVQLQDQIQNKSISSIRLTQTVLTAEYHYFENSKQEKSSSRDIQFEAPG
jgi:hypothetical protein